MPNANIYRVEIALVREVERSLPDREKGIFITALIDNLHLLYSHAELLAGIDSHPSFLVGVVHLILYECNSVEFVNTKELLNFLELVD